MFLEDLTLKDIDKLNEDRCIENKKGHKCKILDVEEDTGYVTYLDLSKGSVKQYCIS